MPLIRVIPPFSSPFSRFSPLRLRGVWKGGRTVTENASFCAVSSCGALPKAVKEIVFSLPRQQFGHFLSAGHYREHRQSATGRQTECFQSTLTAKGSDLPTVTMHCQRRGFHSTLSATAWGALSQG
ncbi:hypothetical protein ACOMHN_052954 [Nucella lapillus]